MMLFEDEVVMDTKRYSSGTDWRVTAVLSRRGFLTATRSPLDFLCGTKISQPLITKQMFCFQ